MSDADGPAADIVTPTKEHWDEVHGGRPADELSWFQAEPTTSLELIESTGVALDAPIVDIGGGSSRFVDRLLERSHSDVTVLDVSAASLAIARARLGSKADAVTWVTTDVLTWRPRRRFALWHDRATFHFLVEPGRRATYLAVLDAALAPGGHIVVATFAADGPETCSGLPVARYSPETLADAIGPDFTLVGSRREEHHTPAGVVQPFTWVVLQAKS